MLAQTQFSKFRVLRAYFLALRILLRYLGLNLRNKFSSPDKKQQRSLETHERTARDVVKALHELQGLFIKIGQTLSVMGYILPPSLTAGLESLQDAIPARPISEIKKRFLEEFSEEPAALFAEFDDTPLASASIGQVHRAVAKTGEVLAVKVQHLNIDELARRDLKVFGRIVRIIDLFLPSYNIRTIYDDCAAMVLRELDYQQEASALTGIAKNFAVSSDFVFPKVVPELSTGKILTLTFVDGVKITDLAKQSDHEQTESRSQLAEKLIRGFSQQVFVDGLYHADPHPGNVLITPEGKIALLDFGAVGQVSAPMRKGLTIFVEGLIKRDARTLTQALRLMGFVSKKGDEQTLDLVVDYFYAKVQALRIDDLRKLDVTKLGGLSDLVELKRLDVSFRDLATLFVIPKDWILLERTLILVTGLSATLDPKLNPADIVLPYVENFLLADGKTMSEWIMSAVKESAAAALDLPREIKKALRRLEAGELSVRSPELERQLKRIRMALVVFVGAGLAAQAGQQQAFWFALLVGFWMLIK